MPTADGRDNVVPFTRDWLGPREDLVPLGPRADAEEPAVEPEPAYAADDFWGENASSLHGVVRASNPGGGRVDQDLPVVDPDRQRRGRRLVPVALLLLVAVVAVLAAIAIGRNLGPRSAVHDSASKPVDSPVLVAGVSTADRVLAADVMRLGRRHIVAVRQHPHHPLRRHRQRPAPHTSASAAAASSGAATPNASVAPRSQTPSYSAPGQVAPSGDGSSSGSASSGGSSSSGRSANSAAGNQAAFGANGTLGPGSSPNG